MIDPVPVGIIGTGYLGRLHARVLTEIPHAAVIGFVEVNDTIAAEVSSSLGIPRFATIGELGRQIRGAIVATPTSEHHRIALELLELGCDVLVEKPITSTPAQARELIAKAGAAGRRIQVGHVERYNPAVAAAAPFVRAPRYIEAERLGVFSPRSLDIDVLLDLMIHDLDLVVSFVPGRVVEIRAAGVPVLTEKVDIANVRLEFEDGVVANLTASRVSSERVRKIRIFGDDSYLSIDTHAQEVKGYRLRRDTTAGAIEPLEVVVEKKEPLRAELEDFLEVVAHGKVPRVSATDGLAALELALEVGKAIDASMEKWKKKARSEI